MWWGKTWPVEPSTEPMHARVLRVPQNLVIAVGLAIDSSVHIAHAFLNSYGTRDERAAMALKVCTCWFGKRSRGPGV